MARNNKRNRGTVRHYNRVRNTRQAELFLYGKLSLKSKAIGYCVLHKCYLDRYNLSEKGCIKKHCKHLKEVN